MAPLAKNRELDRYVDQRLRTFKVKASTKIFMGAFVGLDAATGYARPLVAGDRFLGIAYDLADNSSGSNGDVSVTCYTTSDFDHALSGAAITDMGKAAFASDDNTLTKTATGNSFVGFIVDVPSSGNVIVRIADLRGAQPALTAKDAGTVDATYGTAEADVIDNNRTRIEEIELALKRAGMLL